MNRKIIVLLILIGIIAIVGVSAYAIANGALTAGEVTSESSEVASSESQSESEPVAQEPTEPATKDETEGVDTSIDSEALSDSQVGDQVSEEYDENGDPVSASKYLDEDGDTVANYYDICPSVDDFSSDCETDAYNQSDETDSTDAVEMEETTTTDNDLDKNGDPRSESLYLDEDGDTVANYYDICPQIDDLSDECTNA